MVNLIKLSSEDLELCRVWHGGPECRMLEVYRAGGVFTGPAYGRRPTNCAGEFMSNAEWYYTAWCSFAAAVGCAENQARKSYDKDIGRLGRLGHYCDSVCTYLEEYNDGSA